jgi:type IV pilus assembly protein PilM
VRWLDAMPHPPLAIEISVDRLAAVRWTRTGSLESLAVEPLPAGTIVPSAVEPNLANIPALRTAFATVCGRLRAKNEDVAMLLPDPAIRVLVQHFEEFPRSPEAALPMLRWKLKKSIPFEVDETLLSYMRQAPREHGVDVVIALARQQVIREYEALAESVGLRAGVILSSSLAAVALVEAHGMTLLARISGAALTTVIVRDGILCGYRCTDLPVPASQLTPQMLLEEIFPAAVFYQDTWHEGIQSVRIAGLGGRLPEFVAPLENEFHCTVESLLHTAVCDGRIPEDARPLAKGEQEGLVGWMLNRG